MNPGEPKWRQKKKIIKGHSLSCWRAEGFYWSLKALHLGLKYYSVTNKFEFFFYYFLNTNVGHDEPGFVLTFHA